MTISSRLIRAGAAAVASCVLGAGAVQAETIQLTETVKGTGTFNGGAFTDTVITITGMGVGQVYNYFATIAPNHLPDWRIPLQTVTVSGALDDSTTFFATVTDTVFAFDNIRGNTAGISAGDADLVDLTPADNAFRTYALNANLSETGAFVSYLPNPYATTGGVFSFTSAGAVTFDATVSGVPEPSTWALLTIGFGGVGGAYRRLRRSHARGATDRFEHIQRIR